MLTVQEPSNKDAQESAFHPLGVKQKQASSCQTKSGVVGRDRSPSGLTRCLGRALIRDTGRGCDRAFCRGRI